MDTLLTQIVRFKSNNKKDEDYDKDKETITKHFDFRLNGDYDGVDGQDDIDSYKKEYDNVYYVLKLHQILL